MAAVTDLTWAQLNTALKQVTGSNADIIAVDAYGVPSINVGAITSTSDGGDGVLKFMARLLDAARIAQEAANSGKATGEKLSTFSAPTNTTPTNNLVGITRAMTTRADLSTATRIVGTNV